MLKHGLLSPRSRLLAEKKLLATGRESKMSMGMVFPPPQPKLPNS